MTWIRRILLPAFLGAALFAQTPPPAGQEVVLSATAGGKLAVALASPAVSGLEPSLVARQFTEVLARDLEESDPFGLVKGGLPAASDPSTYKAWADAGAEWLITLSLAQKGADEVAVVCIVVDPRAGKDVFRKSYSGKEAALRRIAHTLADDLVARLVGEKGVAGTRIVFVKAMGNSVKEIWQVDRDGTHALQLTHHGSLTLSPTVAADGKLAYVTYKGGPPEIWGQKAPGGPHVRLYPLPGASAHCSSPSWSPDGKRLAFVQQDRRGNSDIMVLDLDRGRVRQLTENRFINTEPTWNPTGNRIAFTSDRDGSPQVYLMEDDGSNVQRLTHEGNYNASPAWSPQGSMIAYVSRFEGKFDLFVYKLSEGKSYQVSTGVFSSESPCWSPDERRLLFTSTRTGNAQLLTTDLTGAHVRKVSDQVGCQSPRWTRSR